MTEIYKIFENRSLYDKVMILIGIGVFIIMVVNFSLFIYKRFLKNKPKDLSNVPYLDWPWMGDLPPDGELIDLKDYKRESYEQVTRRYDGFGEELYTLIQQRLPDVFKHLKFYMSKKIEPKEDEPEKYSIAVYKKRKTNFVIQLDYYIAICIWSENGSMEIQDWGQDYYEDALNHIAELAGADLQPKLSS